MATSPTTTEARAARLARPILGLDELGERIVFEHAAARRHVESALAHALACGDALIAAKARLEHGAWLPWLRTRCDMAERTAQAYMRLARERSSLEAKSATVADLTVRGALRTIARPPGEPQTPPACIPSPGHLLIARDRCGDNARMEIWVVPSVTAGFFHAAALTIVDSDGHAWAEGTSRPMRADGIPVFFALHHHRGIGEMAVELQPCPPLDANPWILEHADEEGPRP